MRAFNVDVFYDTFFCDPFCISLQCQPPRVKKIVLAELRFRVLLRIFYFDENVSKL